jgi:hypothetical protein
MFAWDGSGAARWAICSWKHAPSRGLEFGLAEKGELAAVFKAEEIGQAIVAYTFGAGRTQQDPVEMSEMCGVIPEHGTGEDVPLGVVGARTVQVGHFGRTDSGACSEPSWHETTASACAASSSPPTSTGWPEARSRASYRHRVPDECVAVGHQVRCGERQPRAPVGGRCSQAEVGQGRLE